MSYTKTKINAITMNSCLGPTLLGIPEIDIAIYDNFTFDASLNIDDIMPYTHFVELSDIDISANVFHLLFFNTQYTGTTCFNPLTNSYIDYVFGILPVPSTATDVQYRVPVYNIATRMTTTPASPNYNYYTINSSNPSLSPNPSLSSYISILSPSLTIYQTGDIFNLQNTVLDNIVDDLTIAAPGFADMFNTINFVNFNKEITNLKTLNDIIPMTDTPLTSSHVGANMVDSLNWNNVLELVRCQYYNNVSNNTWLNADMFAVLKITLIFKTNINLVSTSSFTSTTQVKLRYKMNFKELACFQGAYNKIQ